MTTTYTITIDQSAITAPNFPRSLDWWRHYLPIWFTHPQWWTRNYADLVNDNVTVDEETGRVVIRAENRHRAGQILWFFSRHVIRKFLRYPDAAIQFVATTTPSSTTTA
jgi:hypothetical protein